MGKIKAFRGGKMLKVEESLPRFLEQREAKEPAVEEIIHPSVEE